MDSDNQGIAFWVNEAKKGKRKAQNIILETFWNDVYRYVFKLVQNENDAEDITIETFTKVFSKLKLYNEDFDFKRWMISIAHNNVIDFWRKKSKTNQTSVSYQEILDLAENIPTPEESIIIKQDNDLLMKQLEQLKPKFQKILKMRYMEGKTLKEIAESTGYTTANIKVIIYRGKKLLMEGK